MDVRWIVVVKRDIDPAEVMPFERQEDAEAFYEDASQNWTEVYLCQVMRRGH